MRSLVLMTRVMQCVVVRCVCVGKRGASQTVSDVVLGALTDDEVLIDESRRLGLCIREKESQGVAA